MPSGLFSRLDARAVSAATHEAEVEPCETEVEGAAAGAAGVKTRRRRNLDAPTWIEREIAADPRFAADDSDGEYEYMYETPIRRRP